MTNAEDIRELIAEGTAVPSQRRALEHVAGKVEDALSRDVPYRPEFRAQLRQQLLAQARRQASPWYARPAVWGSTIGVAAAAVVFAIGLQLIKPDEKGPVQTTPIAQKPGVTATPGVAPEATKGLVAAPKHPRLQPAQVTDERIDPNVVPASLAGVDLSKGITVFEIGGRADMALATRVASQLGFAQQPRPTSVGFEASENGRLLQVWTDGRVVYDDKSADPGADAAVLSDENVRAIAQTFLVNAALPVPGQPDVKSGARDGVRIVIYTPQQEGRPIVNARTAVSVNGRGRVVHVEAFAQATYTARGAYEVIKPEEALTAARNIGGATFGGQADLVYARSFENDTGYLQPYWRLFGTDKEGAAMVRYVQALSR